MTYQPRPINTEGIELGEELEELVERLSDSLHDQWALRRIQEGWSYGPQRDDGARKHPCLVPYDELPESEKEYDRTMARETLKGALALGFQFHRKGG